MRGLLPHKLLAAEPCDFGSLWLRGLLSCKCRANRPAHRPPRHIERR
jgi:hypothetical protein